MATLKALAKKITKKLQDGTKVNIQIGTLLSEARDEHFTIYKEGKEPKVQGAKLVAWADAEFGIKKAQAYNLIKIALVFNTEEMQEQFADVPVRVLAALTRDADMMEAATDALDDGETVDSKWLKEYQDAQKPEKEEKGEDNDSDDEEEDEGTETGSKSKDEDDTDDLFVQQLEKEIEELKERVENTGPDMNPHFKAVANMLSKQEPHQVLFIAADADKRTINKAKRDIAKLYHEDVAGAAAAPVLEIIESAAKTLIDALPTAKKSKKK